jgi:UDP-N-acetylglucosamine--N-acetylmuramyl-(pentapeptide) pyrophosphoryl-undecaprenol N-acetylglucosamine transferase
LTIFITGGSQGAYEMNRRVAAALAELAGRQDAPRFRVIHQTGGHADAVESTRGRYAEAGIDAVVEPFITAMGGAYKAADLVVARAGAATCAEIALFGKPALLIPLPSAVRDHQFLNASHLADAGAAVVMRQESCEPGALADAIGALLASPERLAAMSAASKSLAAPDAASRLAALVRQVAGSR